MSIYSAFDTFMIMNGYFLNDRTLYVGSLPESKNNIEEIPIHRFLDRMIKNEMDKCYIAPAQYPMAGVDIDHFCEMVEAGYRSLKLPAGWDRKLIDELAWAVNYLLLHKYDVLNLETKSSWMNGVNVLEVVDVEGIEHG